MSQKVKIRHLPGRGFFAVWRWLDGVTVLVGGEIYPRPSTFREVLVGPYPTLDAAYAGALWK